MLPAQAPCAFTHLQQIVFCLVSGQGPALNSLTDSCQKLRRLQKQEFFLVRDERPANIDTKHLNYGVTMSAASTTLILLPLIRVFLPS